MIIKMTKNILLFKALIFFIFVSSMFASSDEKQSIKYMHYIKSGFVYEITDTFPLKKKKM